MYNKSFRKPMAMLLTLTMVGGLGGITALADETGQASVTAEVCVSDANPELETEKTVEGSVIVEKEDGQAIAAVADATQGGDVSLEITEDVSAKSDGYSHAVEVYALNEDSTAEMTIGGDVTSTSDYGRVVGTETFAAGGGTASLTVGGDVTATGGQVYGHSFVIGGGVGVGSQGEGSSAKTEVMGNVTAEATSMGGNARGAGIDTSGGGSSELTIGGDLTVSADKEMTHTNAHGADVRATEGSSSLVVGGDVTSSGDVAVGIMANAGYYQTFDSQNQTADTVVTGNGVVNIDIGGDVRAEGGNPACGIAGTAYGEGTSISASVGGSIVAEAEDSSALANGAILEIHGAEVTLNVEEDVLASGKRGNGIWIEMHSCEETAGTATVQVGGDVSGQDSGLYVTLYGENDPSDANVTVEGALSAKSENGTAVLVTENVTPDNLKLTVWKIDLDKDGNAVKQTTDWTSDGKPITASTEVSKAIEANIEYIIKVEPTQTDLFAGTQATAKEGENVTVRLNVPAGYKLNGAFTDEGKSVELLKDSSGNYYVVVPRGGGIYLSARLEALPAETQAVSVSYGNAGGVTLENGAFVLTLNARQPSFTFLRSTLEQHARQNDTLIIRTDRGSGSVSISELLGLNEKAVNFRFALAEKAVEIYLDGQMMKTIGLKDSV